MMPARLTNAVLSLLAKRLLARNKQFEGRHQGESCYIFGNGASLKYFELGAFADRLVISCGGMFLHRDFPKLNVQYYFEGHPFFHYRYWINPYSRRLAANGLGLCYKKKMSCFPHVNYFVSLSDYFAVQGDHVYYLHNFSKSFTSYDDSRMDGSFTTMRSGLSGMLGVALFMGFTDITLVGCDYELIPRGEGHFFDFGRFPDSAGETPNRRYLIDAVRHARLRLVTSCENYRADVVPTIAYHNLTGKQPVYKENHEIVSQEDLLAVSRSGMAYKPFPPEASPTGPVI